MDLELTDEQTWLAESVETLLARHWIEPGAVWEADHDTAARVWAELVEFGALTVGPDGLGAIELCLIGRALGARLAKAPFVGSAAVRWALAPFQSELPAAFAEALDGDASIALAQLEPGHGWSSSEFDSTAGAGTLDGHKLAVEHADVSDLLAVVVMAGDEPALVLVPRSAAGVEPSPQPAFDPTTPLFSLAFSAAPAPVDAILTGEAAATVLSRLATVGGLLAAADAVGAAGHLMDEARRYAGERRQFGHTIGSNQALRHLLADMYVRQASSWSTVLYAAAALDGDADDAARTASIAKAYVARAAREVAHGALQVFGGIGFTAEHPAHRFLRRIVVRERQFGDAAHHERALGRALAEAAREPALAEASA
jgi:alkylation response protein AidB-like acyl-CoA dehydrogenase